MHDLSLWRNANVDMGGCWLILFCTKPPTSIDVFHCFSRLESTCNVLYHCERDICSHQLSKLQMSRVASRALAQLEKTLIC